MSTRRNFLKQTGLSVGALAFLGSVMTQTACVFGDVYSQIVKYTTVGLQAFQSVVDLLVGAGVINVGEGTLIDAAIALVKAAFADIQTAVAAYEAAPSAQKMTLAGKIATAITIAEADIQLFWNDLKIPDAKTASLVQGLLGVILSTLAAFLTQLQAPPPAAIVTKAAKLPKLIPIVPKKRSVKEFKTDFNAVLIANGQAKAF